MSFLITDDNSAMRRIIKEVLGELAGDTFEAGDGEESLAVYRRHQPHWVLMDLMMPNMGGLEATEKILKEHPGARVIIVTHQDHAPFREAARKAGAVGYVLKENLLDIRALVEGSAMKEGWAP